MRYNRLYKDNNFLTPTNKTQTHREYTQNLKYEDIPAEVVERAKMIMLQTIGAALAAKGTPIAEKVCRMSEEANGGEGGIDPSQFADMAGGQAEGGNDDGVVDADFTEV